MKHITDLKRMNACTEAVAFASEFPSLQAAWDKCERGDWMLWLAGKKAGLVGDKKRKTLALAACACTRLAAIETAEAWAKGGEGVTLDQVQAAAAAAAAAAARKQTLKQCAAIVRRFYPKVPR